MPVEWILDSLIIQANQRDPFVHRTFTVSAATRGEAVKIIRKTVPSGHVSVVGRVWNGVTHYFPMPAKYA